MTMMIMMMASMDTDSFSLAPLHKSDTLQELSLMPETDSALIRMTSLEILNDFVPEIRGQLQFLDFLVRAVTTDLQRYQSEIDSGTKVFLKQLILMHLDHIGQNGGQTGALNEFSEAVYQWLDDEEDADPLADEDTPTSPSIQELLNSSIDTLNWSGGNS